MKRWLALLLLLAPSSGCMMMDDLIFGEPPQGWTQPPANSCGVQPASFNAAQTGEPELLKR